jgi:hypothetical protein
MPSLHLLYWYKSANTDAVAAYIASRARAALAERMPKKALFGGNSPELVKQVLTLLALLVQQYKH